MPEQDDTQDVTETPAAEQSAAGAEAAADASAEQPAEPPGAAPSVEEQLAERTADLQRLQAEYQNYRKRVERDRVLIRAQGEANVLRSLLTVLDDIGRAEQHGELTGGFKAVADALQQALKAHHLESFGEPGEPFDPHLHEALFHAGQSPEIEVPTIATVVRTGYRVGDDVLRHAQVGVEDPQEAEPAGQPTDSDGDGTEPTAGGGVDDAGEEAAE